MCKRISNRGSSVVELCIVAPIIILIVVNIIFVFLDSINDGVIQGNIYSSIYTYSEESDILQKEACLDKSIADNTFMKNTDVELTVSDGMSKNAAASVSTTGSDSGGYRYQSDIKKYSVEYDCCTDRLRRWQLFGDIILQ